MGKKEFFLKKKVVEPKKPTKDEDVSKVAASMKDTVTLPKHMTNDFLNELRAKNEMKTPKNELARDEL